MPNPISLEQLKKNPKQFLENLTIPQIQALYEQLRGIGADRKALIEDDPASFAHRVSGGKWLHAKHLDLLSSWLKDLEQGSRQRILVSMPPRHGKSELISVWYPLWLLARNPERQVILASYEAEFAAEWGKRVRGMVQNYSKELKLNLDTSSTAGHNWKLLEGGGMFTTGVGGPLTGRGADALIIDDPLKNAEEASSEVMREKMWDWFQTTAFTRIEPGGFCVVLGTRWHQDDLIGRLEAHQFAGGPSWDILKLPALAEKGDPIGREEKAPLWEERFNLEALELIKSAFTAYNWSSLYQQRPTPEEGGGVKRRWWRFYEELPSHFDVIIQSWDLAFKDLKASDFCVGQVWGRDGARFYLLDQVRARMDAVETIKSIRELTKRWPQALAKVIEDRANGPAVISMLQHEVSGMIPWPPKGKKFPSKDAKLQAVLPLIEAGNCYLPGRRNTNGELEPRLRWVDEFIDECAAFPMGTYDDQLDAATQALLYFQPGGWLTIDRAIKEAAGGPPLTTTNQIMSRDFSKDYKNKLKSASHKLNNPKELPLIRPRRFRSW